MGGGFAYSKFITAQGALQTFAVIIGLAVVIWFGINYQPMQARPIDKNMVEQLSSLQQGDLIEDLDVHRVFYVRHLITSGPDLQLVEWAGNKPFTVLVETMARRPDIIKIIRMADPEWPEYAKRYMKQ